MRFSDLLVTNQVVCGSFPAGRPPVSTLTRLPILGEIRLELIVFLLRGEAPVNHNTLAGREGFDRGRSLSLGSRDHGQFCVLDGSTNLPTVAVHRSSSMWRS